MKVIVFCPHLERNNEEREKLTKIFYRKQHLNRIFIIQELCENCLEQLTKGISRDEQETTH